MIKDALSRNLQIASPDSGTELRYNLLAALRQGLRMLRASGLRDPRLSLRFAYIPAVLVPLFQAVAALAQALVTAAP